MKSRVTRQRHTKCENREGEPGDEDSGEEDDVLDLSGQQLEGLGVGFELKQTLVEIDLTHCGLKRIQNLGNLPSLRRLILRQNLVERIEGLEGLVSLEHLDLYDNQIKIIENIPHLPSLIVLDLSFNEIREIPHGQLTHAHLPGLHELYFVNNKIRQIQNIEELITLHTLELGSNRIRVIENLGSLTALEALWLGKNKITVLQGLEALTNLRKLSVQSNRLVQIDHGLVHHPLLEELYLSHNGLTTSLGLHTLPSLKILDLSSNQITKLEILEPLVNLEELWCNDNKLSSFPELDPQLLNKPRLSTVYFERNPISSDPRYRPKLLGIVPTLQQIDANMVVR